MEDQEANVNLLINQHAVFQKIFNNSYSELTNLQPEELEQANRVYKETFPNSQRDLNLFHHEWIVNQMDKSMNEHVAGPSETCPSLIFDPGSRKYLKPQVLPAQRRRRQEKFNLGEFLRQKRVDGDFFQIPIQDREMVEDLMDDLNEDKPRNDQKADIALNRMVQMAAVLNGACTYRLMELHPERRVH